MGRGSLLRPVVPTDRGPGRPPSYPVATSTLMSSRSGDREAVLDDPLERDPARDQRRDPDAAVCDELAPPRGGRRGGGAGRCRRGSARPRRAARCRSGPARPRPSGGRSGRPSGWPGWRRSPRPPSHPPRSPPGRRGHRSASQQRVVPGGIPRVDGRRRARAHGPARGGPPGGRGGSPAPHPRAFATWSAMSPTAPSPTTATGSPGATCALRIARTATSVVSIRAASSSAIASGRGTHWRAGTRTYSARPPSPWRPIVAQSRQSASSPRRQ